jgi:hypothetical protein
MNRPINRQIDRQIDRRKWLQNLSACSALALLPALHARAAADLPALLRAGGCAVVVRHTQTVPGIGDPPNFNLNQCSTQRNLNDEGREQAKRIGQWFKTHGLQPRSIQTSAWCRCKDTAELAFGKYTVLPALNSTFEDRGGQELQTKALRARLGSLPAGQFEVWVTHQVNITALTGEGTSMGEAVIVSNKGRVLGRTMFTG